jgi:hypothetical protein
MDDYIKQMAYKRRITDLTQIEKEKMAPPPGLEPGS